MPYMNKCLKVITILTIKAKNNLDKKQPTSNGLLKTYRFSSSLYSLSKQVSSVHTPEKEHGKARKGVADDTQ